MKPHDHYLNVKQRGQPYQSWPPGDEVRVRTWANDHYDGGGILVTLRDGSQFHVELTERVIAELAEDFRAARIQRAQAEKATASRYPKDGGA